MHISLTPKLEEMVRRKVESGMYNNASEVIRAALRLMANVDAEQEEKLKALRAAVRAGEHDIARGDYTEIKNEDELNEFFEGIASADDQ